MNLTLKQILLIDRKTTWNQFDQFNIFVPGIGRTIISCIGAGNTYVMSILKLGTYCPSKTGFAPSSVGFTHYEAPLLHNMDQSLYIV